MPPARQFRQGRSREPPLRLKDVDATTRNPMFLFRLSGLFLLRYAQRALSAGLFHEPPRNTRAPLSLPRHSECATLPGPSKPRVQPGAFCQPPSRRPISASIWKTWWYC